MRRFALAIGLTLLTAITTATADSRFERSLQKLAPTERIVQICDYTAMKQIRRDHRQYRPDRTVADATIEMKISGRTVDARGAAFRSRGKWYGLSYTCTASPETLKVESFKYKLGDEIPEGKWAAYGLWE